MTKTEAVLELVIEASTTRVSNTAAKRILRACKVLGVEEPVKVFHKLEYCREDGSVWNHDKIERIW